MTKTAVNGQTTRVEEAYLVLSNAIVSQRFPQGTWLRQRTIAAELSGLNLVNREIDRLLLFPMTFQAFLPREQSASIKISQDMREAIG